MSEIRVDNFKNAAGTGAPDFPNGLTGTDLELSGNLTVRGTQTIINSETLDVQDKTVGIASTSTASNLTANNAGITIYGSTDGSNDKNLTWGKDPGSFLVNQPFKMNGVIETLAGVTTYYTADQLVVEMDVSAGTAFTYTMPTSKNIGIVSFKNLPAVDGEEVFATVTCVFTQSNSFANAGWGNTQSVSGIGSQVTVVGYSSGAVAGISTRAFVGTGLTFVGLTTFPGYKDFISFGLHYNGQSNTDANSYDVYITKNGGYHPASHGV